MFGVKKQTRKPPQTFILVYKTH